MGEVEMGGGDLMMLAEVLGLVLALGEVDLGTCDCDCDC